MGLPSAECKTGLGVAHDPSSFISATQERVRGVRRLAGISWT
jgi:hypothetical protein